MIAELKHDFNRQRKLIVNNGRHDRATALMSNDSMCVLHVQHPVDLLPVKYYMNITSPSSVPSSWKTT